MTCINSRPKRKINGSIKMKSIDSGAMVGKKGLGRKIDARIRITSINSRAIDHLRAFQSDGTAQITKIQNKPNEDQSNAKNKAKSIAAKKKRSICVKPMKDNRNLKAKKDNYVVDGMLLSPIKRKSTGLKDNAFVSVAFSTMQGWRPEMEDTHNVILDVDKKLVNMMFFAVFDGHAGQEVSRILKRRMLKEIKQTDEFKSGYYGQALKIGALEMDSKINKMFQGQTNTPGSTANMVLIVENELYVANIGDSRCVGSVNGKSIALSIDHKPSDTNERERILKAGGKLTAKSDYLNLGKSFLATSRAIGDFQFKRNKELSVSNQVVSPLADVVHKTIDDTWDFIILACDGIWDVMSNEEAIEFVLNRIAQGKNPKEVCIELCNLCMCSEDNTTVVLVCFLHNKPYESLIKRSQDIMNSNVKGNSECRLS